MLMQKFLILIYLVNEATQQLHGDSGCSSLHHAQQALCPSQYARPNSHAIQGPAGKKGPPGSKGEKGEIGLTGENGREGRVDYNRLDQLVIDRMKQDIGCSVGMKDKLNTKVRISSSRPFSNRTPADSAILDAQVTRTSNGSWCGQSDERAWIEVKFSNVRLLAGVVTQGNPSGDQWVKTFKVFCGDEQGDYTEYTENGVEKIFQANSDRNSKAFNIFADLLSCRSIKIVANTWHTRPCLRMELLHGGCYPSRVHKLYVKSQGADDGWTCHITVNGIEKSIRRRGFCVVIFNPETETFHSDSFDVHGNPTSETARMISFLNRATEYSIVSIAVQDAAGHSIQPTIITKLKEYGAVGVSCDLKTYAYRDSFAFIGQKLPNNSERPALVSCQHVKRHNGYAAVHATIKTSKYFVDN